MSISQRKDRHDAWWICFRTPDGRRIRRRSPIQTLEGAIEHERALRTQIARVEQRLDVLPLFAESTFAEFAEHWMNDYVAIANRASTMRGKQSALRATLLPAFGHLKLRDISTNIVDAKVAMWMKAGMKVKHVNNVLCVLRRALRCAVEWGFLERAPLIRHHRYMPPLPQYLTHAESERVLGTMEPGFWKTLVLFFLRTGARFGEAAALRWEDLELQTEPATVTIRRAVACGIVAEPKTPASRRTIVLVPELVTALLALRHQRPDTEWVFTSPSGRFYEPARCVSVLKRACAKADVPIVTWHKLRHSCATQLLACGVPLPAIKEVLGHANLDVTAIYTHVVPGLMWEYMQFLSAKQKWNPVVPVPSSPKRGQVSYSESSTALN